MHHDITNRELSKKSGASNEREMKGTDEEKLLLKGNRAIANISDMVAIAEEEEVETMQLTHVIVDCSAIPYVDLMGKDAMVQASEEFAKVEITVFYSHCKGFTLFENTLMKWLYSWSTSVSREYGLSQKGSEIETFRQD